MYRKAARYMNIPISMPVCHLISVESVYWTLEAHTLLFHPTYCRRRLSTNWAILLKLLLVYREQEPKLSVPLQRTSIFVVFG